ncbi:hypothetical protein CO657_35500 (plasmid) [Rhizobium acidisoli]|uniref:FecR protein domain-containing protein n=1 Tax=Rhizobium acidisoli TaxID=1538158 RepID=A0AAE5WVQ4_9HYPH|nr:FecR domain-containing protein [Rhizobium acidisoli]KPH05869.1 hypothetical protein AOG23_25550 [Rhizobium acidisoli]QAS83272.1 hypothetical protein CO657_35500 [Rhizobium acidisoli]
MLAVFRIIVVAWILMPAAALAAADDWRVVKATDQVTYSIDETHWMSLRAGDVVPNRASVSTGPHGRVQLSRGVENITFHPNTRASITTTGVLSRKTEVLQQIGALDLEIEKRSQPHTTVQTPYLAAVVKGTIFHVTVGKTKASVSVDRGLVQVTSFDRGQQSNVGPRQSVTVDNKTGMTVGGQRSRPQITSVEPTVAKVPALGTTKLAGETKASGAKSTSSAAGKGSSSSASNAGNNADSKGNSSSGSSGNSGSNGNGKSGGNGNGNSSGSGNGRNGSGGGNGNSSGNDNSGGHGKGKDK